MAGGMGGMARSLNTPESLKTKVFWFATKGTWLARRGVPTGALALP